MIEPAYWTTKTFSCQTSQKPAARIASVPRQSQAVAVNLNTYSPLFFFKTSTCGLSSLSTLPHVMLPFSFIFFFQISHIFIFF